jgi:hypothetical protein
VDVRAVVVATEAEIEDGAAIVAATAAVTVDAAEIVIEGK